MAVVEAPTGSLPPAGWMSRTSSAPAASPPFTAGRSLVTGFAWTFVAMEILLVGFTVPVFTSIWGLSGSYAGWIAASALAGSLVGSARAGPALGPNRPAADLPCRDPLVRALHRPDRARLGPVVASSAFRFLAGIGLGGMLVVDPSMLAEYLPPQKRGRFLVFLDFFWPVGLLLATGLSWIFLVQVGGDWGWRWLFLAARSRRSSPSWRASRCRRAPISSPAAGASTRRRRCSRRSQVGESRPDELAVAGGTSELGARAGLRSACARPRG